MEIRITLNDETRVVSKIKVIEYGFDKTVYIVKDKVSEETITQIIELFDKAGDRKEHDDLL